MAFEQKIGWWFGRFDYWLVTKKDLHEAVKKIMSAISDAVLEIDAADARTESAIATLSAEVSALKTLISSLQSNVGTISAADQALLDAAVNRSAAIATSAEALAATAVPPAP